MALYDVNGNKLENFISVLDYGAVGDGVTDDSASIQAALDAASSGGIIFFPNKTYLLKSNVLFYSKQTLQFENGATLLQGDAIDNLLMSYCANGTTAYNGTHDVIIDGAVLDGGAFTTPNTLFGIIHCKNITIKNCKTKNGYGAWHNMEINSSYNVKILNCDFEGARRSGNGELIQIDAINNTSTWPWDNRGAVDSTISKCIEIAGCVFHNDTATPAIGNHSALADSFIRIHENVFNGLTASRGAIMLQSADNVDVYNNTFDGCTTGIGSGGTTYHIYNNRFVGVTTVSSSADSIVHNNMVNGSYIA